MKCPSCGKIVEDGSEFCYWCGESFDEAAVPNVAAEKREPSPSKEKRTPMRQNAIKPERNRTVAPEGSNESKTSVSGILIEVFSLLLMIGGMIAGIVMVCNNQSTFGVALLLGSLMLGLMGYGFGRIVCLLTSIDAKMK